MFSLKLKKNKISLNKMVAKKDQKIAIFGSNIYTDWHVILIVCFLTFIAMLYHAYYINNSVLNVPSDELFDDSKASERIVDVNRINGVVSLFDERANRFGGL